MKFTALPAPFAPDEKTTVTKVVDAEQSYPCRRCLQDGKKGEEILLLSYNPFFGSSPYTGPGPVFVHRLDCPVYECNGSVPDQQARRLMSVRAYDENHMMVDQGVVQGSELQTKLEGMFEDSAVDYVHAHYAGPGCFAMRVDRE